MIVSGLSKKAY